MLTILINSALDTLNDPNNDPKQLEIILADISNNLDKLFFFANEIEQQGVKPQALYDAYYQLNCRVALAFNDFGAAIQAAESMSAFPVDTLLPYATEEQPMIFAKVTGALTKSDNRDEKQKMLQILINSPFQKLMSKDEQYRLILAVARDADPLGIDKRIAESLALVDLFPNHLKRRNVKDAHRPCQLMAYDQLVAIAKKVSVLKREAVQCQSLLELIDSATPYSLDQEEKLLAHPLVKEYFRQQPNKADHVLTYERLITENYEKQNPSVSNEPEQAPQAVTPVVESPKTSNVELDQEIRSTIAENREQKPNASTKPVLAPQAVTPVIEPPKTSNVELDQEIHSTIVENREQKPSASTKPVLAPQTATPVMELPKTKNVELDQEIHSTIVENSWLSYILPSLLIVVGLIGIGLFVIGVASAIGIPIAVTIAAALFSFLPWSAAITASVTGFVLYMCSGLFLAVASNITTEEAPSPSKKKTCSHSGLLVSLGVSPEDVLSQQATPEPSLPKVEVVDETRPCDGAIISESIAENLMFETPKP